MMRYKPTYNPFVRTINRGSPASVFLFLMKLTGVSIVTSCYEVSIKPHQGTREKGYTKG